MGQTETPGHTDRTSSTGPPRSPGGSHARCRCRAPAPGCISVSRCLDEERAESLGCSPGTMGDIMDNRALIVKGPASPRSESLFRRVSGGRQPPVFEGRRSPDRGLTPPARPDRPLLEQTLIARARPSWMPWPGNSGSNGRSAPDRAASETRLTADAASPAGQGVEAVEVILGETGTEGEIEVTIEERAEETFRQRAAGVLTRKRSTSRASESGST